VNNRTTKQITNIAKSQGSIGACPAAELERTVWRFEEANLTMNLVSVKSSWAGGMLTGQNEFGTAMSLGER
jgi:hypothetical protein